MGEFPLGGHGRGEFPLLVLILLGVNFDSILKKSGVVLILFGGGLLTGGSGYVARVNVESALFFSLGKKHSSAGVLTK